MSHKSYTENMLLISIASSPHVWLPRMRLCRRSLGEGAGAQEQAVIKQLNTLHRAEESDPA